MDLEASQIEDPVYQYQAPQSANHKPHLLLLFSSLLLLLLLLLLLVFYHHVQMVYAKGYVV